MRTGIVTDTGPLPDLLSMLAIMPAIPILETQRNGAAAAGQKENALSDASQTGYGKLKTALLRNCRFH